MSRWLALLPLIVLVALGALFGLYALNRNPQVQPEAMVGKQLPNVTLPTLAQGQPVPLREAAAEGPMLVNFFASWCAPCIREHPLLMALKQQTGLRIYGVNYKDPSPGGRRFIGRYGNPYAAVGVDADGRAAIEWGVYGMPETFIIDGEGRIVWKHVGPITKEALELQIMPAIRAAQAKTRAGG